METSAAFGFDQTLWMVVPCDAQGAAPWDEDIVFSDLSLLKIMLVFILCVLAEGHTYVEVRGRTPCVGGSLLPPRVFQGLNSGCLMMSLLPTEPSCQPRICHFDVFLQQSVVTHAKYTKNERTV